MLGVAASFMYVKMRMPESRSKQATSMAAGENTWFMTPMPTATKAPIFCRPAHRKTGAIICRDSRTCSSMPPKRNMNMPTVAKHCFVAGVISAPTRPRMKAGAKICTMPETSVVTEMSTRIQ